MKSRQGQYIQSLGIPLDQMSGPLRELVNIGLNRWQQSQPEVKILQNLANSQQQVMQQYYGPTIQELERINNLTTQYFNYNQPTQEQIQQLRQVELQNRGTKVSLTPQIEDAVNVTPTPSYNENFFNQQSSYEIRDGSKLYKDGRFLGTIGGGTFGGGNAGQNQIVMGNDAVMDVPDWVFEKAEKTATETPVGTSPETETPTQTTGGLGPFEDMFGGIGDQTPVPVTPVEQPTQDPIVDPKVPPMYVDPGMDKPLIPRPVPTPIVEDNKAPVRRMPRPEPIRETKYPRQNPRPRPRPRPGLASPSNQQG